MAQGVGYVCVEGVPAVKATLTSRATDERPREAPSAAPASPGPHHPFRTNGVAPGTIRTALQRRAPRTLRRHTLRHLGRVGALLAADAAAYVVLRAGIRGVRDFTAQGSWLHEFVATYFPQGFLGGWQFAGALLIGLLLMGTYRTARSRRDTNRVLAASALATGLVLWTPLWAGSWTVVLVQFLVTVPLVWGALCLGRLAVQQFVEPLLLTGRRRARALLVGSSSAIRQVRRDRARLGLRAFQVQRTFEVEDLGEGDHGCPVDHLPEVIHDSQVDTIFVCGYLTDEQLNKVVDASVTAGCELLTFARSLTVAGVTPHVLWRDGYPLIRLTAPALQGQQLFVKRVMDLASATLGLLVLSPLFALIAVLVKLDSSGPVFFRQKRAGLGGRQFQMLKFRTMRKGADAEKQGLAHLNQTGDPRLFKIPDDPRITRIGAFLRRWSLDELPQLWNVFRGDMALVGPRPFFEADLATYEEHHFRRLGAKPGITGLWQVKGRSSVVDFEEVVRLDREYIERWSVGMDLKILALTLPAVMRRTGAY
jgi:exopolysaccharide biosynthesis polyprenyl glycosylphosphotransferase